MLLDVSCVAAPPLARLRGGPDGTAMPRRATSSAATVHSTVEIVPLTKRCTHCQSEASPRFQRFPQCRQSWLSKSGGKEKGGGKETP